MLDSRNGCRGMAIPPNGTSFKRCCRPPGNGRRAVEATVLPNRSVAIQNRSGDCDQIVYARIGKAFAPRFVKRKLPGKPQNIPWIDSGAAAHSAKKQIRGRFELVQWFRGCSRGSEWIGVREPLLCGHNATGYPREHARRCGGHNASHPLGALRSS